MRETMVAAPEEIPFQFSPLRGVHVSAHFFDEASNLLQTIDFTGGRINWAELHGVRKFGEQLRIEQGIIQQAFATVLFTVHVRTGSFEDVELGDYV